MCGIVGLTGTPKAVEWTLQGLQRLEYRGYDSAGIATLSANGELPTRKAVGKLTALLEEIEKNPFPPTSPRSPAVEDAGARRIAIGHTRWATHGQPTTANAHPHTATYQGISVAVVHNGIIENFADLRTELEADGAQFLSQTDTETLPHLIARELAKGSTLTQAVRTTAAKCRGNFAFVALSPSNPDTLVGHKRGAPLCLALDKHFHALVSDPLALAGHANTFIFLHDDDTATITPNTYQILNSAGQPTKHQPQVLDLTAEAGGKGGYKHYMLKEIHEQPATISRILQAYLTPEDTINIPLTDLPKNISQINLIACGTAYYAGLVGKYLIEQHAAIPTNVDMASEFRYRNPPYQQSGVCIAISQSGETADTLAALEHAKAAGQFTIALTNVPTSSIARTAHAIIPLLAGREIAVASTKAFTAMVTTLLLLSLQLSQKSSSCPPAYLPTCLPILRTLPTLLEAALANPQPYQQLAKQLAQSAQHMLYLGRGLLAPLAYEGALKMKEISYIHAEGYPSGEMKHGPIALVDHNLPVLTLASGTDPLFEKTISNFKEVEARGGQLILLTDAEGAAHFPSPASNLTLITIPSAPTLLTPILFALPLQLLAYFTAVAKGTDVDQPRNLAKSVTVE